MNSKTSNQLVSLHKGKFTPPSPHFLIAILFLIIAVNAMQIFAQCVSAPWPNLNQNVGIHTGGAYGVKPLHIDANNSLTICQDPAIRLSYQAQPNAYYGHLALVTPGNTLWYSGLTTEKDLILQNDEYSEDLFLTTRNNNGRIRFTTTPTLPGTDVERMTILPTGQIGIYNNEPQNLLSVRNTTGIDFWNNDVNFQDIRFNCYAGGFSYGDSEESSEFDTTQTDNPLQTIHKNVQGGFSSIIQNLSQLGEGKLLIATSNYNAEPNSQLNFFEQDPQSSFQPRGLMI